MQPGYQLYLTPNEQLTPTFLPELLIIKKFRVKAFGVSLGLGSSESHPAEIWQQGNRKICDWQQNPRLVLLHIICVCTFAATSGQETYFYLICGLLSMSGWFISVKPSIFWFIGLVWTPVPVQMVEFWTEAVGCKSAFHQFSCSSKEAAACSACSPGPNLQLVSAAGTPVLQGPWSSSKQHLRIDSRSWKSSTVWFLRLHIARNFSLGGRQTPIWSCPQDVSLCVRWWKKGRFLPKLLSALESTTTLCWRTPWGKSWRRSTLEGTASQRGEAKQYFSFGTASSGN